MYTVSIQAVISMHVYGCACACAVRCARAHVVRCACACVLCVCVRACVHACVHAYVCVCLLACIARGGGSMSIVHTWGHELTCENIPIPIGGP